MASLLKSITHIGRDLGHVAYEQIVPYAMNNMQYIAPLQRVARGTTCIAVGATLAWESGLVDIVKSKIFKAPPALPPQPLTTTRILRMGAGIALMGYGAYAIATAVTGAWQYIYSTDPTVTHPI